MGLRNGDGSFGKFGDEMVRILEIHFLMMEAFQTLRKQFLIGLELLQLSFDSESDASTIFPQRVPCQRNNAVTSCHVAMFPVECVAKTHESQVHLPNGHAKKLQSTSAFEMQTEQHRKYFAHCLVDSTSTTIKHVFVIKTYELCYSLQSTPI